MTGIANHLAAEYPDMNANWDVSLVPLREQMTGNLRRPLWILLGAVAMVLLIACVNVAGILLMKAGARHRELAIRVTLGASPARVLSQMLTESVILATAAGILGIGLAWWGTRLLARITPAAIADLTDLPVDWRVLLFALATALTTGLIFGLAPGLSAMRTDLNATLRAAGRSGMSSAGWVRIRGSLVVAELMLAQVLLAGAGLLIHSLIRLQSVPPGFHPERVVSARLALPETRYKDLAIGQFYQRLLEKVTPLPGVEHAAVTRDLPLSGSNPSLNFQIEGRPALASSEQPRARFRTASGEYFPALGIRLVRGRYFDPGDSDRTPAVAIINETLARREWPGADPLGRRIRSGFDGSPWCTIIGIVADIRHAGLDTAADAEIYYHYLQVPPPLMGFTERSMTLVVRTRDDPAGIVSGVRNEVAQLDGELALYDIRTADELISGSVAQPRFRTLLLGLFAAAALILAAIGLYGLLASSVVQRTNEMGIRRALGATTGNLLGMVVGQGLWLAVVGIVAGLVLAAAFSRLLSNLLFGVGAFDWAAFVLTPALLLLVAAVASLVPALRATRVDPAVALRDQ
jgi:putative ABC transport system permease protein